jgi:hypothetical protein
VISDALRPRADDPCGGTAQSEGTPPSILTSTCDTSTAHTAPTDETAAERLDNTDTASTGAPRADRFYRFPGGCVS